MKVYIENRREDQAVTTAYNTPIETPFEPFILHIAFASPKIQLILRQIKK